MSSADADQYVTENLMGFLKLNPQYSWSEAKEVLRDIYWDTVAECDCSDTDEEDLDECEDSDDSDLIWSAYREDCESGDCDCCDTDEDASRWGY
jgi:hypothetical protein